MKKINVSGDATCAAPLMLFAPPLPVVLGLVEVGVLSDEVREVEDVVVLAPLGVARALVLVEEEFDVMVVEELLELDKELGKELDKELEELLVLVLVVVEDDEDETEPIPNLGE